MAPRPRARPAGVIFDMDGVLVDSEPLHFDAVRRMMARHGVEYTEAQNEAFLGVRDRDQFTALRARHGLAPDAVALVAEYTAQLLALIPARTVPMPGVPEVIRRLRARGRKLAVASSSAPAVIAATLRALRIEGLFAAVVSGLDVDNGKPAPDIFLETARRLALAPGDCLVVEDSRNGLLAAKAAGMPCAVIPCAVTRGQSFAEADFRLVALPDILSLVDADTAPAGF